MKHTRMKKSMAFLLALILAVSLVFTGGALPVSALTLRDEAEPEVTTETVNVGDNSVKAYSADVVETELLSSHTDKTSELTDQAPDYPTGDDAVSLSCTSGLYDDLGFNSRELTQSAQSIAADESNQNPMEGYSFVAPEELIVTAVNRSDDHVLSMKTWDNAAVTNPTGLKEDDTMTALMDERGFEEDHGYQTRNGVGVDIDGDGIDEFVEFSLYEKDGHSHAAVQLFIRSGSSWQAIGVGAKDWNMTSDSADDYILNIEAPQSKGYTAMVAGNFDHSADGSEELAVYLPDKGKDGKCPNACVVILHFASDGSVTQKAAINLSDINADYGKMGVDWQLPTVALSTCSLRLGEPVSQKGTYRYEPYTDLVINISVPKDENRGRSVDGTKLTMNSTTAICEFNSDCQVTKKTCFMYNPFDKMRMTAVNSCEADLNGDGYKELVVAGVEETGLGDNSGSAYGSYSNSKSLLNIIYYTGSEYKLVWDTPKEVEALGTLDPNHFDSLEPVALCAAHFDPTSASLQDQICLQGVFLRCDGALISGEASYIMKDQNGGVGYCVIPNTAPYREADNFPGTVSFTNLNDSFNPAGAVGADGDGAWIDASYAGYFLTESSTACVVHVTTDEMNGQHDKVYFDYQIVSLVSDAGGNLSCSYKTWNDYVNGQDEDDDGTCMYACFLNCDDDAFYYRYTGTYTSYSSPVLFSVIQAPPYYEEANSVQDVSFTITSSIANNSNIDAGLGFEVKITATAKLPFFKTGSETEFGADAAYSYAWSYNKTVAHTLRLHTDQDYAIVYVVPILVNTYEVLECGKNSEPKICSVEMPMQPIFTPLSIEQYNAALDNNQDHSDIELPSDTSAPKITDDLLAKSSPGDPVAYYHDIGDVAGVTEVGSFDTDHATDKPGVTIDSNTASAGSSLALGSSVDNSGSLTGHLSFGWVIGVKAIGTGSEITPSLHACFGGGGGRTKANEVSFSLTYEGLSKTMPDDVKFSRYDNYYSGLGTEADSEIFHYDPGADSNAVSYQYTSTAVAYPLKDFTVDLETITGIDTRPFKDDTVYELSYYTTSYSITPEPAKNFTLQSAVRNDDGSMDITLAWDSTVRNIERAPDGYNLYMMNVKNTDHASRTIFLQNRDGPIPRNLAGSYTNFTIHLEAGNYNDRCVFYLAPVFRDYENGVLKATEGILSGRYEISSLDTLLGGSVKINEQPENSYLHRDTADETACFTVTAQKNATISSDMRFDWQVWDREAQTWNSVIPDADNVITVTPVNSTDSSVAICACQWQTKIPGAAKDSRIGVPVRCVVTCGNNEVNSFKVACLYLEDPELKLSGNPSKVYDGTPAGTPAATSDSAGAVTYAWYQGDTALTTAPTDAGTYTVRASVAEEAPYAAGQAEQTVTISPAQPTLALSASAAGAASGVTATVAGLLEADGKVAFTITKDGVTTTSDPVSVEEKDGVFQATLEDARTAAGTYTVQASYTSTTGNYSTAQAEQTFVKDGLERTVTVAVDGYTKTCGDDAWSLMPDLSTEAASASDVWSFAVIQDSYSGYSVNGVTAEPAVTVSADGQVTVNHAGSATIQVTLTDSDHIYNDASACVTVTVDPVLLTVTSYADPASAAYGQLDAVQYGLTYEGFVNGDTAETFTQGYGTLSAVPVADTAAASDTPYPVHIVPEGVAVTINGHTVEDAFFPRDYTIRYVTGTLTVTPQDIADTAAIIVSTPSNVTYNGKEQKQSVTVKTADGVTLEEDVDYTLAYSDDLIGPCTVTVTVTGQGNYQGTRTVSYRIDPASGGGSSSGGGSTKPADPGTTPADPGTDPNAGGTPASETFVDVARDAFYHESVTWAVENGITNGVDETHFAPEASCTRAQMVTFLWRAAGSPEPTITTHPFLDLDPDAYYFKAVLWAVENGITQGTSPTTFDPDGTVNRGQAITFLYRFRNARSGGANPFVDVDPAQFYYDAVRWGVENGITNGVDETHFAPAADCLRGQIVTFLYRTMGEG